MIGNFKSDIDFELLNEIIVESNFQNIINMNFINNHPNIFFEIDVIGNVLLMYNFVKNNVILLNQSDTKYLNELLLNDNIEIKNKVNILNKYSNKININILSDFKFIRF